MIKLQTNLLNDGVSVLPVWQVCPSKYELAIERKIASNFSYVIEFICMIIEKKQTQSWPSIKRSFIRCGRTIFYLFLEGLFP